MKKYLSIFIHAMILLNTTSCVQTSMHIGDIVDPTNTAILTIPNDLSCTKIDDQTFPFKDPRLITFAPGTYTLRIEIFDMNIDCDDVILKFTAKAGHQYEVRAKYYMFHYKQIIPVENVERTMSGSWIAYIYDLTDRRVVPHPDKEKNEILNKILSL